MEVKVTTKEEEGETRVYVGTGVCRGPGVLRLVLTWPYERGGRIVEIPLSQVDSVSPVKSGALGEEPQGR